ncbi:hypothetical protein ACLI4Q_10420 [Natrialbaceae archaeon A-CW1-1]
MTELIPIVYYGGLTILFFFRIYGIVSFALDVKNRIIPGIRQYRRGRARSKQRHQTEQERRENEEQLY